MGSEATESKLRGYPAHILPNLFLGNAKQAQDSVVLQELGIKHVIDATNVQASLEAAQRAGATHYAVNVLDDEQADLTPYFAMAAQALADALRTKSRLLIHCQAGVSRSVTLVCAALMQALRMTLAASVSLIVSHRPFACPNPAFRRQLCALEGSLFGASSSSFADDEAFLALLSSNADSLSFTFSTPPAPR